MSLTAFKRKSVINYGSKRSGIPPGGYWLPQGPFGHATQALKEARVVYNDPWYWVCMENTTKKCIPGERKMRINLEEFMGTPLCQEEENNELSVIKLQEEENIQNNYEIAELDYDRVLYQKLEEYLPANRERDANYVRNLEILKL